MNIDLHSDIYFIVYGKWCLGKILASSWDWIGRHNETCNEVSLGVCAWTYSLKLFAQTDTARPGFISSLWYIKYLSDNI